MLHKIDSKFFHPSINQSVSFFHLLQLQINNGGGIHCTLYGMVSRSTEKMEPKKNYSPHTTIQYWQFTFIFTPKKMALSMD